MTGDLLVRVSFRAKRLIDAKRVISGKTQVEIIDEYLMIPKISVRRGCYE